LEKLHWSGTVANFYGWPEDKIFEAITSVPENWKGSVYYTTKGYQYFVEIFFENGKVNKIIYGQGF